MILCTAGESYAGVYVPTLAEAIVKGEQDGTYTGAPLTGIAVGNGCSGTEVGICGDGPQVSSLFQWEMQYLNHHHNILLLFVLFLDSPQGTLYEWSYLLQTAFVDANLKRSVNAACNWTAAALNDPSALSSKCVSLLNSASKEIDNINMYNIYGDW